MSGFLSVADKFRDHKTALELFVHDEHCGVILREQWVAKVFIVVFNELDSLSSVYDTASILIELYYLLELISSTL